MSDSRKPVSIPVLRGLLVLGCAAMLAACAGTGSKRGSDRVEVEHPKSVAGFTVESVHQAEDPFEGTRVRYQSADFEGLRVDLFAYLVGVHDDHAVALDSLRDSFVGSMELAKTKGIYQSYEFLDRTNLTIEVNGRPRPARYLRHVQVSPTNGELISLTYLLFRPPFALKVRASFPSAGNESFNEAVERFVRAVIPAIQVTYPASCTDTTIHVDPDADSCEELPRKLVESYQHSAALGCADFESAADMQELLPKMIAECRAEETSESKQPPAK